MYDVDGVNEIELYLIWILYVDERYVILKFFFKYKLSVNDGGVKVNVYCFVYCYCKCFIECIWDDGFSVNIWIFGFDKELDCYIIFDKSVE